MTANPFDPDAAAAMAAGDMDTDNTDSREVSNAEAAQIHNGQVRMAYRLAILHGAELMHIHAIGWHYWDGKRWAEDSRGKAKQAVLDVLRQALAESVGLNEVAREILRKDVRKCESESGVNGVLGIARALPQFAVTVEDVDADPYLLNVDNGTLDLRTFELRAHDPSDRITKVARAAYDPTMTGATWNKFLDRVLPDEAVRGFLQRYVGLSLCGRVLEHKLAILTGEGRNGKGVFYGAVNDALGDYGGVAEPELFLHKEGAHPAGQMDLRGMRFAVVSENDKDRRLAEATVKRLTGGDRIKARRMHQNFVWFDPSHTAALVTNHLPKVSGDDPALWARLRVVPFDVVIPAAEQDPHLPEKLELETTAVLTWMVDGWRQYQSAGLAEPDEVSAATAKYQQDSDAYTRFLAECTYDTTAGQVKVADLWDRWSKWCDDDGADKSTKKALGLALERKGYADYRNTSGRYRKGLMLLEEEEADPREPYGQAF